MGEIAEYVFLGFALFIAPVILVVFISLFLVRKGLRGAWRDATFAFFRALGGVLAVGIASYAFIYQIAARNIADCQAAAEHFEPLERSESDHTIALPYYDCEDEGLIVILPFFMTSGAVILVFIGAVIVRFGRASR